MISVAFAFSLALAQDATRPDIGKANPRNLPTGVVREVTMPSESQSARNRLIAQEAEVDNAYRDGSLPYADWARLKRDLANSHLKLALAEAGQSSDGLMTLDLQQAVEQANRTFQTVSNIMKARHDTAKAVIKNVR